MSYSAPTGKPLVLRDEIHGDMAFDPLLREVIDHECFQRLRYIKQLGLAEYVFPCATHTRFQHSLGAGYLAGEYCRNLVESWLSSPFRYDGRLAGTTFLAKRTEETVRAVAEDPKSFHFWRLVAGLGGLLHDIGHGPWSHSFENLNLQQDFGLITGRMAGALRAYFDEFRASGRRYWHEDISVIYIFHILTEVGERVGFDGALFAAAVATLVNRKMLASGQGQPAFESEIEAGLRANGIKGGVNFHRLLRPIISGPFDVDRMDYIQRDGRNTGVHIGGIEWPRIVTKLMPCLAEHRNDRGEPAEVVLVSNLKNQHVLDDFIFSLFQMYAQVYMHPKIVGLEESIRKIFEQGVPERKDFVVTFDVHQELTDERFRAMLSTEMQIHGVDDLLFRREGKRFKVTGLPADAGADAELTAAGFARLQSQERPMMKDGIGLFLFTPIGSETFVEPWEEVSPIARQFHSIHHAPQFWIRAEA